MIKKQIKLFVVHRLSESLVLLATVAVLSGCANSPTKNNGEVKNANVVRQDSLTKPNVSPSNFDTVRQDTKLNIQFDWWKLLQSPQLNTLIEKLFTANPTVESAQNVLIKLQQSDIAREGYFYSSVNVRDAENGRGRLLIVQDIPITEGAKFIGDAYYDIHEWQLSVGYLPELLTNHNKISATTAELEVKNLQMEATYRTLAANLIACAIQDASLRAQMLAARKIVAIEQSLLTIVRKRIKAGLAESKEEAPREQSVEFASQALQRLKEQYEQIRGVEKNLLNVSGEVSLPENIDLAMINLSLQLPLELSAALIEQRPDMRAAQLEMLPANNKYQTTSDLALRNVENTLIAIHNDAITLKAAIASEQENNEILDASQKQYKANMEDYQDVVFAEQGLQYAMLRASQARAKQLGNAVMLYHALGGGWWAMDDAVKLEIDSELGKNKLIR